LLNLTVLADILLGTIDTWNDTAIQELNPELGDLLPADPITILNYEDDALSVVFAALANVSQDFAFVVIPLLPNIASSLCACFSPHDTNNARAHTHTHTHTHITHTRHRSAVMRRACCRCSSRGAGWCCSRDRR
jgi:hypothetical protein